MELCLQFNDLSKNLANNTFGVYNKQTYDYLLDASISTIKYLNSLHNE